VRKKFLRRSHPKKIRGGRARQVSKGRTTQPAWKVKSDAREAAARAKRAAEQERRRAERKRREEKKKKKQPGKIGKAAGAVIAAANKLYWDKKKWGF
jgi:septal ring factor EnvC (AmiA/AmiB activator)